MRKFRKRKGKSENNPPPPQPWEPQQVIERINRARGDYLTRTGEEFGWKEIGRFLGFEPSTQTDVKKGKRPFRVAELGRLAAKMGVRAGYLAFNETPMRAGESDASLRRHDDVADSRPLPRTETGRPNDDQVVAG
jgi:hypothetical protein